jgi:hypothetical protein
MRFALSLAALCGIAFATLANSSTLVKRGECHTWDGGAQWSKAVFTLDPVEMPKFTTNQAWLNEDVYIMDYATNINGQYTLVFQLDDVGRLAIASGPTTSIVAAKYKWRQFRYTVDAGKKGVFHYWSETRVADSCTARVGYNKEDIKSITATFRE